jgi:hypothetical protein
VAETFADTGEFFERYNVVDPTGPTPGRYRPQPGFAWTDAVFMALVVRVIFGHQPNGHRTGTALAGWADQAHLEVPSYPWQ